MITAIMPQIVRLARRFAGFIITYFIRTRVFYTHIDVCIRLAPRVYRIFRRGVSLNEFDVDSRVNLYNNNIMIPRRTALLLFRSCAARNSRDNRGQFYSLPYYVKI